MIIIIIIIIISFLFLELPPGFPVITEGPGSHKSIEVGHNAVLQCSASGNPSPTIYWLRENMRLDLDTNPRYSILDKGFPGMYS
jgi:netrin-G3 ligand